MPELPPSLLLLTLLLPPAAAPAACNSQSLSLGTNRSPWLRTPVHCAHPALALIAVILEEGPGRHANKVMRDA
jgi:hypothetical protein